MSITCHVGGKVHSLFPEEVGHDNHVRYILHLCNNFNLPSQQNMYITYYGTRY